MIQDQLLWEEECLQRGQQRYFDRQQSTKEKGTDLTDSANYILRDRLQIVGDLLKDDCKLGARGKNASYNKLVRQIAGDEEDYLKVGYIGLKYLLAYISRGKKVKVTKFVSKLGSTLETELKCKMFESEYPAYFHTVMRS